MSKLLEAFDAYNEFERRSFYTLSFDALPSDLTFKTPLDESKENMERALSILNFKKNGFLMLFKNWNTEDSKNADFSKDFSFEQLYINEKKECLIWISLDNDTLHVEFLYNCLQTEMEKWIINMNHSLRSNLGISKSPVFQVLTKSNGHFDTEDVRTDETLLDINKNYNDDFKEVHDEINQSIASNNSGLILLHGLPGTGKTTYIKSLITEYKNSNFIFMQNEFVNHLLDPDFISFLLTQRNAILIIEDAEKVLTTREGLQESSIVSTILQLTDGLFSDYLNIKVICTFNTSITKIDPALLRKGRMIASYEFKTLSTIKTKQLLSSLGFKNESKEMTISDIYNYQQKSYEDKKHTKIGF